MKKNVALTLITFAALKWDDCLSFQVLFDLPVQITVQLVLDLEASWLDQDVNELEFELSRMYADETNLSLDTFSVVDTKDIHIECSKQFKWNS